MKNLKKLFVALLALVASFGLISAVSAEGETTTGTITVENATVGKTYEIYKIFDLTYSNKTDAKGNVIKDGEGNPIKNIAYTIDETWAPFFQAGGAGAGYIVDTNSGSLNAITVNGVTKYINITDTNVAEFTQVALTYAATLKKTENIDGEDKIISLNDGEQVATSTTVQFTGLALGYYLVYPEGATDIKEGNASICSITSTLPDATVQVKAKYPEIQKSVNDYSVEVGQIVTFTITGQVPDTTGYTTYTYTIEDTMSAGLLFNDDIDNMVVKFGTTPIAVTPSIANNGFTLTFNMVNYQDYKGQTITVTYNAKVTKNAIDSTTTKNSATLTYSNDPKDSTKTTTTPPVEKYLYSADITVIKVDGEDNDVKLAGAKFILKKEVVEGEGQDAKTVTYYYKATEDATNGLTNVEWTTNKDQATEYTTDANGNVTFAGLEDGTYYLVETEAPEGYNLLVEPTQVNVSNAGTTTNAQPVINQVNATVENNSGTSLPSTGGMGTTLFIIVGSLLTLGSAIVFITNKRISKEF